MIILQQQQQSMLGMFLPLILITVAILISIDAKKRGMPFIWVLLVIFTAGIGIIPYFIFRKPKNGDKKYRGGLNERIGKH